MTQPYTARTAYGAPIPRFLGNLQEALEWAEENAEQFPGCRITQQTAKGDRTIWKHEPADDIEAALAAQALEQTL